jgi:septal ring factor EnvC (AmiA/AmiB activator)
METMGRMSIEQQIRELYQFPTEKPIMQFFRDNPDLSFTICLQMEETMLAVVALHENTVNTTKDRIQWIQREMETHIEEKNAMIREKEMRIEEKNAMIREKETHIQELNAMLQEKDKQIRKKNVMIRGKENTIDEKDKLIQWMSTRRSPSEVVRLGPLLDACFSPPIALSEVSMSGKDTDDEDLSHA